MQSTDVKKMDIKEFYKKGFLQECNRQFFHPLGLALEVELDDDGNATLDGIWDNREDPEGIFFAEVGMVAKKEKMDNVEKLRKSKLKVRLDSDVKTDENGIQLME